MKEINFTNQTVIITGAGQGLGRAYALEFAQRGANVVVNDIGRVTDENGNTVMTAQKVVDEIVAAGGKAIANFTAVNGPEDAAAVVAQVMDTYGRIDVLINNAGIVRDSTLVKMPPESWESVLAVHVKGMFYLTQAVFRVMKEQNYGRIVMTTSPAGLFGNFGQVNYTTAKMGIVGFMNTLKLEGGKYNVKVNTIAPTAFTPMTQGIMPEAAKEAFSPNHVASMVLYLASEDVAVSGGIYQAGMGCYAKVSVVCSPFVKLGSAGQVASPEMIAENWEQINTLEGAQPYMDAGSNSQAMSAAAFAK